MDLSASLFALRWLVLDTFRQTLASRVFWILLALTGLCTLFCLSISIEGTGVQRDDWDLVVAPGEPLAGPNPNPGRMSLLFGAFKVFMHRDAAAQVRLVETILGTWVAGSLGVLLTLILTAGFLPDFLQPTSATVLLAKPVSRGIILTGKFLGIVAFVALQALVFFLATWAALGIRTGVWHNAYLLGAPLLVLHFSCIYSFSMLLAVTFRSTTACALGVLLFWAMCYGLNYSRHAAVAYPHLASGNEALPTVTTALVHAAYWSLPKPIDLTMLLENALSAAADKVTLSNVPEIAKMIELGQFHPGLAILSCLVFAAVMIVLSAQQLSKLEY